MTDPDRTAGQGSAGADPNVVEALRRERDLIARIAQTSPAGIVVVDRDGQITFANAQAERVLGLHRSEITGLTYNAPEWRITDYDGNPFPEEQLPFSRVMDTQQPVFDVQHTIEWPDGRRVLLSINAAPILNDKGQVDGMVSTVEDNTDRVRTEMLLRAQGELEQTLASELGMEQILQTCIEIAIRVSGMDCGGVYIYDEHTGELDLANHVGLSSEFLEHASHYDADSEQAALIAIGKPIYSQHAGLKLPSFPSTYQEGLRALAIIPVLHENRVIACLNIASHTFEQVPDFARAALETIAVQIGNVIARAKARESLRQSQANLETLFESLTEFLFVLDKQGHISRVNRVVLERLGYHQDELLGKNVLQVHPLDRREEAAAIVADMIAGKTDTCTIPLMAQNGTLIPVETKIAPGTWNGKEALFGVSRDISERLWAEEALRRSEARYRSIVDSSPMGMHMYELGPDGGLVFTGANPAADRILGVDNSRFIGKTIEDAFPALADSEIPNAYRRVARTGEPWQTDQVIYEENQIAGAYDVHAFQIAENHVVAAFVDVTTRQRMQEALRESEERYRRLFETMTQGVVYQDADGQIIDANPAAQRILGLTLDQLRDRTSMDPRWRAIHEDGSDFSGDTHPAMVALRTGSPVQDVVMGVCHSTQQKYTWIKINAVPLIRLGADKPYLVHVTFEDINEQRLAKQALLEGEERYRRLVEGSPDIVYSYSDVEGGLYFSPSVEPILGYPPEQFCSQRGLWYGSIHPDDQPSVRQTIEEAAETGGSFSMEYRIQDAAGNEHWFLDRSINIQVEEKRTIIEGLVTDITARKRAEQAIVQASRLEATMTLAGGIAHKVNNLMASVLGYAEMLKMDARGQPDAQEMLEFISDSAQETSQLARQMLAFARGGRYMPQEVDLNDTIQGILRARQSAISPQIEVTLDTDPGLWNIEADAAQMSEVVLNLFANAVEAIDESGEVTVRTENRMLDKDNDRGLEPGAYVCLRVQDTGCGMSEETLSRIFEPFFTTKFQGRGMGLAAVYGIVENHGGHIAVRSQMGEGSTFEVCLPAHRTGDREP